MPQLELTAQQQQQQQLLLHPQQEDVEEEEKDSALHEELFIKLLGLQLQQQQLLQQEKVLATVGFAVGVAGGEKDTGLCDELYVELLGTCCRHGRTRVRRLVAVMWLMWLSAWLLRQEWQERLIVMGADGPGQRRRTVLEAGGAESR